MRSRTSFFLCSLIISGCAHSLDWEWAAPDSRPTFDPDKYKNEDAIFLLQKQRYMLIRRVGKPSYTEFQNHRITKVLTEKGFGQANVRIPYSSKDTFVHLSARTINPDGKITEVSAKRIYDEKASQKEKGSGNLKVKIFAFENVQIGSLLEYIYTIKKPVIYKSILSRFLVSIPTQEYQLEILGSPEIAYAIRAFNTKTPFKMSKEGGLWKIGWTLKDIPKSSSEDFSPGYYFQTPWWLYDEVKFGYQNQVIDMCKSWDSALRWNTRSLYKEPEKYYAGFDPQIDYSGCAGEACKVQRTLAYLKKALPFRGHGGLPGRQAKKVLTSGSASSIEKNRLLWYLLKKQNIKSTFALTNRYRTQPLIKEMPTCTDPNHLLLQVPAQGDISQATWVDAGCEYCTFGEIPSWLYDSQGILTKLVSQGASVKNYAKTEFQKIQGKLHTQGAYRMFYQVDLEANGDAEVKLTIEQQDNDAQSFTRRVSRYKDEDWKKQAQKEIDRRHRNSKLLKYSKLEKLESNKVRHSMSFQAKGYATVDGKRLILPLSLLRSGWDRRFKSSDRNTAVVFREKKGTEERLQIKLPEGFQVINSPKPKTFQSKLAQSSYKIEQTGRMLTITRSINLKQGVHPPSDYSDIRKGTRLFASLPKITIELESSEAPSKPVARQNESKTGAAQ